MELPAKSEVRSVIRFFVTKRFKIKGVHADRVNFAFSLTRALLKSYGWKFCTTPPTTPILHPVIFAFSAISNIISTQWRS